MINSRILKLMFFVFTLFFVCDGFTAQCRTFSYSGTDESGGFEVYRNNGVLPKGCPDSVILTGVEYARLELLEEQNGDVTSITAISVMSAFTFGFGAYMTFWFVGFKIRLGREAVRLL